MRGIEWRLFHQNQPFNVRDIQGEYRPHTQTPAKERSPDSPPVIWLTLARTCYFPILERTWGVQPPMPFRP